jgi:hypothetical protein
MNMAQRYRFDLALFGALALVMLATRTHSLSQYVHLPDTSWASFFIAGYYIRSRLVFPALFLLALVIDLAVIGLTGGSSFCFTPAYWMLLAAYGAMWLAGRFAQARLDTNFAVLPKLLLLICGATLAADLLSSGGFYWLSGRFADPTIAEFVVRTQRYFPGTLVATLLWAGVAAACHTAVVMLKPRVATAHSQ